jgi:hypothetical protein
MELLQFVLHLPLLITNVDYLVVAGGGGGGGDSNGGGGGAGGYRESYNPCTSGCYSSKSFSKCNFFTSFSNSLSNYSWCRWCWWSSTSVAQTKDQIQFFTITSAGGGRAGSIILLVTYGANGGSGGGGAVDLAQLPGSFGCGSRKYSSSKSSSRK